MFINMVLLSVSSLYCALISRIYLSTSCEFGSLHRFALVRPPLAPDNHHSLPYLYQFCSCKAHVYVMSYSISLSLTYLRTSHYFHLLSLQIPRVFYWGSASQFPLAAFQVVNRSHGSWLLYWTGRSSMRTDF